MKQIKNRTDLPLFFYSGEFLSEYLRNQLGRSENTITSYRNCLRLLKEYIEEQTGKNFYSFTIEAATRDFFLKFLCWIESRGSCKATRNQRLACIKTYTRFVMDNEFELARWCSNVLSIPMSTAEKPLIGWLREEALNCILKQPKNTRIGMRDRLFMMLMYESAARVSEILNLKVRDLNIFPSGSSIRLQGKGNKIREVPISDNIAGRIKKYFIEFHKTETPQSDELVFFTVIHGNRNQMSIGNAERIVAKYSREARKENSMVPDRVTPHMFRYPNLLSFLTF